MTCLGSSISRSYSIDNFPTTASGQDCRTAIVRTEARLFNNKTKTRFVAETGQKEKGSIQLINPIRIGVGCRPIQTGCQAPHLEKLDSEQETLSDGQSIAREADPS